MFPVSRAHLLTAQMLLLTLREMSDTPRIVVGNLDPTEARVLRDLGAVYIDERDVDLSGRMPRLEWTKKYREAGWYLQMFLNLSVDRYVDAEHVLIFDSEVFVFDNWDESKLFDPASGRPRCFYWVPSSRKSEWEYRIYRGAAFVLEHLPGCEGVLEEASSDTFHRHISGVQMYSTSNLATLWRRLERETDLDGVMDRLFNHEPDLAFSDDDFYGIAADRGVFDRTVPVEPYPDLLGWYDNHDDPVFNRFAANAMWSMCQQYWEYPTASAYLGFMQSMASRLDRTLPALDRLSAARIVEIPASRADSLRRAVRRWRRRLPGLVRRAHP